VGRVPPVGAGQVHMFDAAAMLWTARRASGRAISRLPMDPEWDQEGIRVELVAGVHGAVTQHRVEQRRHRVGQLALTVEATIESARHGRHALIERIEALGVHGDRRPGRGAGDVDGGARRQVLASLVDQSDHELTGALEVGSRFFTGEFDLLTCDLGVSRDGGELCVHPVGQVGHELTEACHLGVQAGSLLVAEDLLFSQRVAVFLANVHRVTSCDRPR
jgi:hypothetical protein